jgi:hypothetical protein
LTGQAYAIFGIGAHYSLDFSVKMPDAMDEALVFDQLSLSGDGFTGTGGSTPTDWVSQVFGPNDIPVMFDRYDFGRTPFSLGAKVYVDIIPFIDVIELGGGFAAWEYQGFIRYPSQIDVPDVPTDPSLLTMIQNQDVSVTYDTMDLTLEGNDITFPGITGTPFIKLDMGLTIRKYIPIPAIEHFLSTYGGAGFDVHFSTPVPSAGLLEDAIGDVLNDTMTVLELQSTLGDPSNQQKVTEEIISRLMTPHFGMNIVVGFMVKPPVIPLGLYVDGKFMIPFGPFDEDAEVTGLGFKLNTGLVLHFGKRKD